MSGFKDLSEAVIGVCNRVFGNGYVITYTPNGGSAVSINAVFDNAWVDIQGIMALKPTLQIQLSQLASAPGKGDQVSVDSVNYKVVESRPDGLGASTLILQKV